MDSMVVVHVLLDSFQLARGKKGTDRLSDAKYISPLSRARPADAT